MWMTIITALLPVAIKILNMYFDKVKGNADQRAAYLKFLEAMQKSQGTPAKIKTSYDEQIERLKKETEPGGPTNAI